jgi:hypothetical protein
MMDVEKHMIGAAKAIKILIVATAVISWLTFPAYPQGFSKKGGASGPPVESHPKVDEKAYKAALDRIPASNKKYDPWGIARPSEPASVGKKSN